MTGDSDLVSRDTRRVVFWGLGLLAVAVSTSAFLAIMMILFIPRGLLFGLSAVQVCPMNYFFVWMIGTLVAYRKYRSLRFAGLLTLVGVVLLPVVLFSIFVGIFITYGPLKLK